MKKYRKSVKILQKKLKKNRVFSFTWKNALLESKIIMIEKYKRLLVETVLTSFLLQIYK